MMSIVETSAQCRSSKNITSGRTRDTSWKSTPSSRFIRSGEAVRTSARISSTDDASVASVATWRYQVGATVFISSPNDPPRDPIRPSSTSSSGRYASDPASRSEQRPRASTGRARSTSSSAMKSSTRLVLPMPGSPVMASTRLRPALTRPNAARSRARSSSRPTVVRRATAADGARSKADSRPVMAASSACTSAADGRRPGSLASIRMIRASTTGGSDGFSRAGGTGCSETIAVMIPKVVGATNGRRPVAIS